MAFSELTPQARRNTGASGQFTQPWPVGSRRVDLRIDIWGPSAVLNPDGSVTNPFTGVTRPFSSPSLAFNATVAVQFPGDATWYEQSGGTFNGNAAGTWGKPGNPQRQPVLSATLQPETPEPAQIQFSFAINQGPFDAGLSYQLTAG